jgi:hypothetical protein
MPVLLLLLCIMDHKLLSCVFFSGEGPRSRRYGHTAAMKLIAQPYDEDDDYFCPFPSNGAPVE